MEEKKNNFFRGFTWKKFIILSLVLFIIHIVVEYLFEIFGNDPPVIFSFKYLIKTGFWSVVMGFLFSLWLEPGTDNKFWNKKK